MWLEPVILFGKEPKGREGGSQMGFINVQGGTLLKELVLVLGMGHTPLHHPIIGIRRICELLTEKCLPYKPDFYLTIL